MTCQFRASIPGRGDIPFRIIAMRPRITVLPLPLLAFNELGVVLGEKSLDITAHLKLVPRALYTHLSSVVDTSTP